MASIIFSDLHPTGAVLFQDSESFMDELEEQGSISVRGGAPLGDNTEQPSPLPESPYCPQPTPPIMA
jgi:hypothetical protein